MLTELRSPGTAVPALMLLGLLSTSCADRTSLGPAGEPTEVSARDRLVDVGGHRLHLRRVGTGSPVVVLDMGFGETFESWESLALQVVRRTGASVCLYDRASYGRSEAGPLPRTAGAVAAELATLLQNAAVEGPYVLVGHSLGGVHVLLFAAAHPRSTAGMLLLDPPPRGFLAGEEFRELRAQADQLSVQLGSAAAEAEAAGDEVQAAHLRALASEREMMFTQSVTQLEEVRDLGDLPLIVVAAGVPNPAFGESAEDFQAFWNESCRTLASLSSRGQFRLAQESSHHLHRDVPEVVLEAISDLVQIAREAAMRDEG